MGAVGVQRIVITAVGTSMVGMAFGLLRPDLLLAFIGFSTSHPEAAPYQLGEVRAVYGGLFAVIGIFTLLSAIDPVASRSRLVVLAWCWLGLGGGRLVGVLLDGDPGPRGYAFMFGEFAAGILLVACAFAGDASSTRRPHSHWESWGSTRAVFAAHVGLYRLLRGRLVGHNILILTTVGRRSGRKRSTPLFFVHDGDDYVVIASNGGEDRYPGWWHNIRSNPDIDIEVGARTIACRAEKANDDDIPRLWEKLTAVYGGYATYRERTQRELTILRLRPRPDQVAKSRSGGDER